MNLGLNLSLTTPRGRAAAWIPTDLAGHIATWTGDGLGADTSAVASWVATYGTGTLAEATNRPVVGVTSGKKAAVFDGANDRMSVALARSQPFTVGIAMNLTSLLGGRVMDSTSRCLFGTDGTSLYQLYAGSTILTGGAPATGLQVWVVTFNGASSSIVVDGVTVMSGNPGAAATGGTVYFGSGSGYESAAAMKVYAASVVAGTLTAGEKTLLDGYLRSFFP